MVNATVSHEMRNPINSIISQNMKMGELLRLIKNLVGPDSKIPSSKIKEYVLNFTTELSECLQIQMSSTKILNFCVNDMLSLAQINQPSKFRKNFSKFDIKEAIKEVMEIQQEKADYQSIKLESFFTGFNDNYKVCSDSFRIQQVLLNFQSNALKFTPANGHIKI